MIIKDIAIEILTNESMIRIAPALAFPLYLLTILTRIRYPHASLLSTKTLVLWIMMIIMNPCALVAMRALLISILNVWNITHSDHFDPILFFVIITLLLTLFILDPSLGEEMMIVRILRYMSWFALYFTHIMHETGWPSHRLQSLNSMITAALMSPVGIWEHVVGAFPLREEAHLVFVAYCIMDSILGSLFFPEFFTLIEGWIHHGILGGFLLFNCIRPNHLMPGGMIMIVEIPSLILFASRIDPWNPHIRWARSNIFPSLFLVLRILLPLYDIFNYYLNSATKEALDGLDLIIFTIFLIMNIHWFILMMRRKWGKKTNPPPSRVDDPLLPERPRDAAAAAVRIE